MMRLGLSLTLFAATIVLSGCGESSDASTQQAGQEGAGGQVNALTPGDAVFAFLEAVREGNHEKAGGMLTTLAQKKTAEMDLEVAPPGSDTASFEVGETRNTDDQQAEVQSTWTDVDREGNPRTDHITWILRRENENWRIAGMSTAIIPGHDPIVLDFERPQEMLDRQRQAEAAMQHAEGPTHEAKAPEDPFQGQNR